MHSSRPVPAFFDADEPPQQLPVLSSQSEMYYRPKNRVRVSAMEEMSLSHHPIASTCNQRQIDRQNAAHDYTWNQFKSNNPQRSNPRHETLGSRLCHPGTKTKKAIRGKFLKPNGEVGRPGQGGYNLEDQLGWGRDGFKNLKRFVKKAVRKHLDPTKCQSLQNRRALETMNKTAIAEFPDLDDFEGCWPVQDLVLLQLKYSSFRARQQQRDRTTPPHETIKTNTRRSR
ncbi:hypothetical protein EDD16DRAFT_1718878 [Pisolithus croceorrhizus]|nr:hypothetical protein EDD16DRAFT_1718878 [Pisolithus croceorrhizus]